MRIQLLLLMIGSLGISTALASYPTHAATTLSSSINNAAIDTALVIPPMHPLSAPTPDTNSNQTEHTTSSLNNPGTDNNGAVSNGTATTVTVDGHSVSVADNGTTHQTVSGNGSTVTISIDNHTSTTGSSSHTHVSSHGATNISHYSSSTSINATSTGH